MPQTLVQDQLVLIFTQTLALSCPVWHGVSPLHFRFANPECWRHRGALRTWKHRRRHRVCSLPPCFPRISSNRLSCLGVKKVFKKEGFPKQQTHGREESMEWGKGQDHRPSLRRNSNSFLCSYIYRYRYIENRQANSMIFLDTLG